MRDKIPSHIHDVDPPHNLWWYECMKCGVFYNNKGDGSITKENIWICNSCIKVTKDG